MELFSSLTPYASYYDPYYSAGVGLSNGALIAILVGAIGLVILFACLTGAQARKKGYSYGAWWCLSFFLLGWIALVIICCMSDKSAPATYHYNSTWKCQCGQVNAGTRRACLACGRSKNQPKVINNWICPNCDNRNPESSLYCSNCGTAKTRPMNNNFNNNVNQNNNFNAPVNSTPNYQNNSNVQSSDDGSDK